MYYFVFSNQQNTWLPGFKSPALPLTIPVGLNLSFCLSGFNFAIYEVKDWTLQESKCMPTPIGSICQEFWVKKNAEAISK